MIYRFKFSLLTLVGAVSVAAILLATATKQVTPKLNQLRMFDGEVVRVFEIAAPEYRVHTEGDAYFLTVCCSAARQVSPLSSPQTFPSVEFSIPFVSDPTSSLVSHSRFSIPVYSEEHGNLTNFYYWSHCDIENGVLKIHRLNETFMDATIIANNGELMLRAQFTKSEKIGRSFD